MKARVTLLLGTAAILAVSSLAFGSTRTFDFNSVSEYGEPDWACNNTPPPNPPLFNRPGYGYQTSAFVDGTDGCGYGAFNQSLGTDSLVTQFFSVTGNSNELRFSWADPTNDGSWVRVPTYSAGTATPTFPNPTVYLGVGSSISMKIMAYGTDGVIGSEAAVPTGQLEIALCIREMGTNVPIGTDGGTGGLNNVEFIGIDTADANGAPVGGVVLNCSVADPPGEFATVKWTFVDNLPEGAPDGAVDGVDVSVTPYGGSETVYHKKVAGFSGDGILSAANNRGTIDSVVIRKAAGDDTTKKWYVDIDNLMIDAPGVVDPVIPPTMPSVVFPTDTQVTVRGVDSWTPASQVRLLKNHADFSPPQIANPGGSGIYTFTNLTLAEGDVLTVTQTVLGVESAESAPVKATAVVYKENFDSYADQAAFAAVWQSTSGTPGITLAGDESASCSQSAKEPEAATGTSPGTRYVDLVTVANATNVNGTDEVPLWLTFYLRHGASGGQRNYVQFNSYTGGTHAGTINHLYHMGCYNGLNPTDHYQVRDNYDGGPNWFVLTSEAGARKNNQWVKMQIKLTASATEYYVDDVLAASTARFGANDPITTVVIGSGLSNVGVPAWFDNISISYGPTAVDPFGPPSATSPTVAGPFEPSDSPSTVNVTNIDATATEVRVYADATLIGTATVTGETSKTVDVSSLPNNTIITATQVIGGVETCRSTSLGTKAAMPAPTISGSYRVGLTSVTVATIDPRATLVKVYVNGVAAGSASVSGQATQAVTVPALVAGQALQATQVINGYESPLSTPAVNVFTPGPGKLRITLGVREQPGIAGPVGTTVTAGASGTMEWIGSTATAWPAQGKLITPGPNWQTLTFWSSQKGGTDPTTPAWGMSGNGTLDQDWMVLEHLAISIDKDNPKTGPYALYIDSIENEGVVFGTFESGTVGSEYMFNHPRFSGTTSGHLATSPNLARVSTDNAFDGTKSDKIEWAFVDGGTNHYLRLTTSGTSASAGRSPQIHVTAPVTIRFKLCAAAGVNISGVLVNGATSVTVTDIDAGATNVTVYANGSSIGTAATGGATTVTVPVTALVSGQSITATQTIDAAEGCFGTSKVVDDCLQIPNVVATGPLAKDAMEVTVTGIDTTATLVTVYVNGASRGSLAADGTDTLTVPISSALAQGDEVKATQTISGLERCVANASAGIVGSGSNTGILLTLGIRENTSLTGPVGADGGTSGSSFEWLGATATISGAPQGKLIQPMATWQTVTFTPGVDTVMSFTGGNGVLDGTYGVLEHLAIASTGTDTGPYKLYVDNVTSEGTTFETFETYAAGDQVMFQEPTYSGSTSANLLTAPSVSAVDITKGDASANSARIEWQFIDAATSRWARVTTAGDASMVGRPRPQINLTQPITLRVLLEPACAAPTVGTITPNSAPMGKSLTGVAIVGADFVAGQTSVKLTSSRAPDVVATNVTVTDSAHLTCDLVLPAFPGKWNVVVTTCGSGTLTDGFTIESCYLPRQDADGDGDVDLGDFGVFQGCFNGPNRPYNPPPVDQRKCGCFDADSDLDVDLTDFGKFQGCFNGPNRPANAGC